MDMLNSRLAAAVAIVTLMGVGLAFMDSRHASAMDVQALTDQIMISQIEDLEYKIQECELRIRRILLIPELDRDLWDATQLEDDLNKKA